LGVALLTAGCTGNNEHALYQEVGHLIPSGIPAGQSPMTMADAETALRGAGFSCGPDTRGRDCSRSRSYAVVETCVQRVILVPDRSGAALSYYYVPRIPCLGTP
jgi:hypothetical protein